MCEARQKQTLVSQQVPNDVLADWQSPERLHSLVHVSGQAQRSSLVALVGLILCDVHHSLAHTAGLCWILSLILEQFEHNVAGIFAQSGCVLLLEPM